MSKCKLLVPLLCNSHNHIMTPPDPLAGLEHSNQCFCALSLSYNSQLQPESACSWPCMGDSTQICGGSRRLSIYNYTSYVYPQIVTSTGAYKVQGCYIDAVAARVLDGYSFTDGTGMTVQECVGVCQGKGCGLSLMMLRFTPYLCADILSQMASLAWNMLRNVFVTAQSPWQVSRRP